MPEVHDFLKKQWEVVENERKRLREKAKNERIAKERDKRLEKIALFVTRIIPWIGAYLIPIITIFVGHITSPYGMQAGKNFSDIWVAFENTDLWMFLITLLNLLCLALSFLGTLLVLDSSVLVSLIISIFLYFGFCGLLVYFFTGRNIINLWLQRKR